MPTKRSRPTKSKADSRIYIKWLRPDKASPRYAYSPIYGYTWTLPTQEADGSWIPSSPVRVEGELFVCENGIHICAPDDLNSLLTWHLVDTKPYLVQWRGDSLSPYESQVYPKVVVREARLVRELYWSNRVPTHALIDLLVSRMRRRTYERADRRVLSGFIRSLHRWGLRGARSTSELVRQSRYLRERRGLLTEGDFRICSELHLTRGAVRRSWLMSFVSGVPAAQQFLHTRILHYMLGNRTYMEL